jgi:hypothetical protein
MSGVISAGSLLRQTGCGQTNSARPAGRAAADRPGLEVADTLRSRTDTIDRRGGPGAAASVLPNNTPRCPVERPEAK